MTRPLTALLIVLAAIPLSAIHESAVADGVTWQPRGRCIEVSNRKRLIRVNCNSSDRVEIETGDFPFGVTFGADFDGEDAPAPRPRRPGRGNGGGNGGGRDCHPAYTGCLPIVDDLDCPEINDRQVRVRDPEVDPYGLDVSNGVGNGITCDDIG